MNDLLEPILRDTFEKRAAQLHPDARRRLMAIDYRPRRRRIPVLPALGATGLVGAAVALALIFTLGSSPTPAFAGWTPTPTRARPGETAAAMARCHLGRPVLIDTRGPFTAAVYARPDAVGTCLNGASFMSGGTSSSKLAPVGARQIQVTAQTVSAGPGADATVLDGRAGAGVRGVAIRLSDGRTVRATVAHGWYLGWWPGTSRGTTVEIITRDGTHSFRLPALAAGGAGSCAGPSGGGCASVGPVISVGG